MTQPCTTACPKTIDKTAALLNRHDSGHSAYTTSVSMEATSHANTCPENDNKIGTSR